jgi:hypothetical protein
MLHHQQLLVTGGDVAAATLTLPSGTIDMTPATYSGYDRPNLESAAT